MTSAVCGYYGKLPISPEFLRLHAAGPELRWLDDWLQRGVLYAKSKESQNWPKVVAESDLWSFLYVPAPEGRMVCGVLFASLDKAGRSFPFLSFLLLERNNLSRKPWLVPIMVPTFLETTTCSLQSLRKDLDWNDFCRKIESTECHIMDAEWAQRTYEQYTQNYPLTQSLTQLARVLKKRASVNGIKFPLVEKTDARNCDLGFWLEASLKSVSQELHHEAGVLSFWNRNAREVGPCALVSIGPGSPHLMRFIVSPNARDEAWIDVIPDDQSVAESNESRGGNGMWIGRDQTLSLEQFLKYLSESG